MKATKTIYFRFEDKSSKRWIQVSIPYYPQKAADGMYSRIYKGGKKAFDTRSGFDLISGKKWFKSEISERTVILLDKGISLDVPFKMTDKDYKIVEHYFEGLKMAL